MVALPPLAPCVNGDLVLPVAAHNPIATALRNDLYPLSGKKHGSCVKDSFCNVPTATG